MEDLKSNLEQIRACGYTCEAGPLENNIAFTELTAMAEVVDVLYFLYACEINCRIQSFFDRGWEVRIGDALNGFEASAEFDTLEEVAVWLQETAVKLYPKMNIIGECEE